MSPSLLRNWFSRTAARRNRSPGRGRRPSNRPTSVRPHAESLERRDLLSGSWTNLAATGTGPANGGAAMLSLSDGTILIQNGLSTTAQAGSNSYSRLSPQVGTGSYVNGVWSSAGSMGEARLFFGSAVLPDGRVFVIGGEYGLNGVTASNSNTAEIFNPRANNGVGAWTYQDPFPNNLSITQFGDDPIEVLNPDSSHPDGQVLVGYLGGPATYLFNPTAAPGNQWKPTGGSKLHNDQSDEESWVKLPDGSILSYDVYSSASSGTFQAQRYIPSLDTWVEASAPGNLSPTNPPSVLTTAQGAELGPAFLDANGNVIYFGANGNTAIYNSTTSIWSAGPAEPQKNLTLTPVYNQKGQLVTYSVAGGNTATSLVATDDPGAMLPNGRILIALSPLGPGTANTYSFPQATYIYEYDPNFVPDPNNPSLTAFNEVTPPGLTNINAFALNMVVLPTGQVLLSNEGNAFQVYTEDPATQPLNAARPSIASITPNLNGSFHLTGVRLNGISEGANYGDDNQSASNYPIVRLTDLNGNVSYATTSKWSSTQVATGSTPETVDFLLPSGVGPAVYYLSVIANGVSSTPVLFILGSSAYVGPNGDTVTVGYTTLGFFGRGPTVTVDGTVIFYNPAAIAGIDIDIGANSVVNVQQTNVPVDIEGTGNDAVNIGSQAPNQGGTLANINGTVHVGNSYGSTTFNGGTFGSTWLTVDDSGDTSAATAYLGTRFGSPGVGYIYNLSPILITYDYLTTASLTLNTGTGGATVNVLDTGVPTVLQGNGYNGRDSVNIGDARNVGSILGDLTIENQLSYTTVNVDDSADAGSPTVTLSTVRIANDNDGDNDAFGQISGLAPALISYEYADTSGITVRTGTGGAAVNVLATGVTTSLQGNGYNGRDSVRVGDRGGVWNILGDLVIENQNASTDVTVDDSTDAGSPTATLQSVAFGDDGDGDTDLFGQISGLAPALISYEYSDTSGITVNTGMGGSIVNVQATGVTTSLEGNGVNGRDSVNVGYAGSVGNIQGDLIIQNPSSYTVVNVDDSADGAYQQVTLNTVSLGFDGDPDSDLFGQISGLASGMISYEYLDTSAVTIHTGGIGATVNVLATGVATSIQGNGFRLFDTSIVNVGDGSNGVQNILGDLTIENSTAYTAVNVEDTADPNFQFVTLSTVTIANDNDGDSDAFGQISGLAVGLIRYEYFDTSSVTINTSAVGATVDVLATGTATSLRGSGFGTTVNVGDAGSVANIQGDLTVENGRAYTAVNVDDSSDPSFRSVTLQTVTLPDDGDGDSDAAGQISGLAPALISYEYLDTSGVTISTGISLNIVALESNGVPTTVNAGADTVLEVTPQGQNLDAIGAPLTVVGSASTAVIVDDQLNPNQGLTQYTLTSSNLTRSAQAVDPVTGLPTVVHAASISFSGLGSLALNTGVFASLVDVESTAAPTTVDGGSGTVFEVSTQNQNLDALQGVLTLVGTGANRLTIDDQMNPYVQTSFGARFYEVNDSYVRAQGSYIDFASIQYLTLNVGNGPNYVTVLGTPAGTSVAVNGGSSADHITVGNNGTLDFIAGPLALSGGAGNDVLILDDRAAAAGESYVLTSTTLTRTGAAPITFDGTLESVALNASPGNSTLSTFVDVQGTAAGTGLTVNIGIDTDVSIQNARNTLDDVLGPITINGQPNNPFSVNDLGTAVGHTYTLMAMPSIAPTANVLTRTGAAPITYTGMNTLQMTGGTGSNVFNVESLANNYITRIYGGGGLDVFNVSPQAHDLDNLEGIVDLQAQFPGQATANASLAINDQNHAAARNWVFGASAVTVYPSAGSAAQGVQIYFSLFNRVVVNGGGGGDSYGAVGTAPTTVLRINAGSGNDTFTVADLVPGSRIRLDGGGGVNTLVGPDIPNIWNVSALNGGTLGSLVFANMQSLVGGSASDTFRLGSGKGVSGFIDGGGGTNTLDYSSYTSGVNVNLTTGMATGVGLGVSNIQNLIGSSASDVLVGGPGPNLISGRGGNDQVSGGGDGDDTFILGPNQGNGTVVTGANGSDTLVGPNSASTWTVSGANAGNVNGIAFTGIANLVGGSATDRFALLAGANLSGTVDGKGGGNTLDYSGYGSAILVNLQTGGATAMAGFANVHALAGSGQAGDQLIGQNIYAIWMLAGPGTGTVGSFQFSALANLTGGTGSDIFKFKPGSGVSGVIDGGGGTNLLDYSAYGSAIAVNLQAQSATGTGGFAHMHTLAGSGSANDHLTGPNTTNVWNITANNGGTINGTFVFSALANLTGGTGVDTFKLSTGRSISGNVDGGGAPANQGDWLNYTGYAAAVTVNLATGVATGIGGQVLNIPDVLGGSQGNSLTGNAQGNILVGGSGSDVILGGSGRSLLIGGRGSDTVTGGAADDLVIAGYTNFDTNTAALMSIMAEWQRTDETYTQRISDLQNGGGYNGSNRLLLAATVHTDASTNLLTGGAGMDWFFKATQDTLTDWQAGEQIN